MYSSVFVIVVPIASKVSGLSILINHFPTKLPFLYFEFAFKSTNCFTHIAILIESNLITYKPVKWHVSREIPFLPVC